MKISCETVKSLNNFNTAFVFCLGPPSGKKVKPVWNCLSSWKSPGSILPSYSSLKREMDSLRVHSETCVNVLGVALVWGPVLARQHCVTWTTSEAAVQEGSRRLQHCWSHVAGTLFSEALQRHGTGPEILAHQSKENETHLHSTRKATKKPPPKTKKPYLFKDAFQEWHYSHTALDWCIGCCDTGVPTVSQFHPWCRPAFLTTVCDLVYFFHRYQTGCFI